MDSAPGAPPGFQIIQLSGPLLLGNLLHWGLFGTLSVQLYLYYQAFPNDRWSIKCLVYTVYTIELVQTILLTHDAFIIFGYGFGDPSVLAEVGFDWLTIPIMSGLVAFIGQSFYAYRVHVLSKSWFIPILIVVVALTSSVGAFIVGAFTFQAGSLALINHRKNVVATVVWCGASALSDITIAVCMTYYLSKHDTGFRQTHMLVSTLIRLTIETGSLTTLVVLAGLALFLAFPDRNYYATAAAIVPKLYANSILVVLNSRIQMLGSRGALTSSMDAISAPSYLRNTETDGGASNRAPRPSHFVAIHREVLSDMDGHDHVELKTMSVASDLSPCV
ncbi:hypothetical protein DFH09DRAFT_157761 [Mycena vulgaris]|nr:hypothetical protein DFH09DRAFT_157761 [Mycena vulgaris]